MPTHVALLRGINLGGRNRLAMADLRAVVSSLGHTDVATYIQSGNVVFTAAGKREARALAAELERAIAASSDVRPSVVVLPRDELAQLVADNPFPHAASPKLLHAVFMPEPPGRSAGADIEAAAARARDRGSRDEVRVVGRTLFLHTPDGFGRSELAAQLMRAGSGAAGGTARNWATVTKLLAMLDG